MIIGIDLGTTNSLVAYFDDEGPKLIPNALGSFLTPSAVHLNDKGEIVTGEAAKSFLITHPMRTTSRFKRLMGTKSDIVIGGRTFRPEMLSAMILQSLKSDAETHLNQDITDAIISVPAYFNDSQRKATIAAAQIAGLNVVRLINEPTAAALAYGLQEQEDESTFLVIDLGGGTFDVSILELFSGVMEVRACAGDAFLGGEDFIDRLTDAFILQLKQNKEQLSNDDFNRLRACATKAMHNLYGQEAVEVSYRYQDNEEILRISRAEFEVLCKDILARMRQPLQRAINDANITLNQIKNIVLVGGATRLNAVRNLITKMFNRFPDTRINPDHVVALGAAVQAGLVSRHHALEDIVMTDVCPFTLGIETAKVVDARGNSKPGYFSPLIERNTTIPASHSDIFHAIVKGQTEARIAVYQGESPYVKDNIHIGEYRINIPRNTKEYEEFEVRFTYDVSGVLEVQATVLSTKSKKSLVIESNPGVLTQQEIQKRFKELEKIKIHPRDQEPNILLAARLKAAFENCLGDKRIAIGNLIADFNKALESQNLKLIAQKRKEITENLDYLEGFDVFDF